MRILAISDVHDRFERFAPNTLPDADVCLVAGDLTNYGKRGKWRLSRRDRRIFEEMGAKEADFSNWQGEEIARAQAWLTELARRFPVFWIPGNHDIGVDSATFGTIPHCECILDSTVTFQGLTIHGVSMSPCYDKPLLAEQWDYMTAGPAVEAQAFAFEPVNIVLSHGPPLQCCDAGGYVLGEGQLRLGSPALRRYLEQHAPHLVICGHIHEARGHERLESANGVTDVYNVAESCRLIALDT